MKIAIAMPATATTMPKTITAKMEAMTAVDDWPTCGVFSGTLDDTGDLAGANSTCLFEQVQVYKRE